ncbi:MAG: AI-2E family transporter [Rubripirellula sp.]|nr:AI-2E family transporter [Rubripirellula sp.]
MTPPVRASQFKSQTICLVTLTTLAVIYTVYWLRPVLVPLVVAIFVVSGVSPILVTLEKRLGVTRIIAAALTFLAGVVMLGLFGFTIWASIVDLSKNSDRYRLRVRKLVAEVESRIPLKAGKRNTWPIDKKSWDDAGSTKGESDAVGERKLNDPSNTNDASGASGTVASGTDASGADASGAVQVDTNGSSEAGIEGDVGNQELVEDADELGNSNEPGQAEERSLPDNVGQSNNGSEFDNASLLSEMRQPGTAGMPTFPVSSNGGMPPPTDEAGAFVDAFVRQGITVISQSLVMMVSTSVVVLIFVFFLLIGTPTYQKSETLREIDLQIRSYLALKTTISIFTGMAFGMALRLFGVPMAFTFGVMAFLLNFVPNVGPLVASLLPIPLIILDPDGSLTWMAITITVICSIQLISGNVVEPKIMGNSSDLHPVTILLALMFWGMMWGVIGMFLATPITAAVKIVLERIDQTRPIASLMAGRFGSKTDELGGPNTA